MFQIKVVQKTRRTHFMHEYTFSIRLMSVIINLQPVYTRSCTIPQYSSVPAIRPIISDRVKRITDTDMDIRHPKVQDHVKALKGCM